MPQRLVVPTRVAALTLALCAGCTDRTATQLATATEEEALQAAQCTYQGVLGATADCEAAHDACLASGATAQACASTLAECLPAPPERAVKADGGCGKGGGGGGEGPGGKHGQGGHDGHGDGGVERHANRPLPEPVEVAACRSTLAACLAAEGADVQACRDAEHACVKAAFAAAFAASCAELESSCTGEACARISERCNRGVDRAPPDGGTDRTAATVQ